MISPNPTTNSLVRQCFEALMLLVAASQTAINYRPLFLAAVLSQFSGDIRYLALIKYIVLYVPKLVTNTQAKSLVEEVLGSPGEERYWTLIHLIECVAPTEGTQADG